MIASSRSYAIGMVHFQIGGGWKVVIIILSIYLALFGAGVAVFFYADYMSHRQGFVGLGLAATAGPILVGLLMGVQGFALLLVGGYRVSSAIRHDISSRMLESHRLMPITSPNAVFGYLFGPTMPVIVFALLNLAISCAFGASVGVSFSRMVLNQGVIFFFAIFVWSLIGLSTFVYRHMFFIGIAVMFLGTCTGLLFYSFIVFPGLSLLLTPFLGETIFNFGGGPPTFQAGYGEGILGQAALFALFFAGACRLYRGAYATLFTDRQALAILAVWAGLSAAGIYHSDKIGLQHLFGTGPGYDDALGTAQIIASIAACCAVAVIPIWCFLQEQRHRYSGIVIHLLFIAVVSLLVSIPGWGASWMQAAGIRANLLTLLIAGSQVVALYAVLRMVQSIRFIFALLITAAVFLFVWVGPLILELARLLIVRQQDPSADSSMSILGTFSPLADVGALWSNTREISPIPGLIGQWVVAFAALGISRLIAGRKKQPPQLQPPAPTALPPQSAPSSPPSLPA